MASISFSAATLSFLAIWVLLALPAQSLNCTSQTFKNKPFENCIDLTNLNSYLHWTHNASNSSLSIAFVAAPSKPDGWISWGINPTAAGMVGLQALIAFKSKGAMVVKTYNISGYRNVDESELSFAVWDLSAQDVAGVMTIFASVKVPENAEEVNQVWQVGPSVSAAGVPAKHEFGPDNLGAKSKLALTAASAPAPAPADSASNGTTGGSSTGSDSTGSATSSTGNGGDARKIGAGLFLSSLAIFIGSVFVA